MPDDTNQAEPSASPAAAQPGSVITPTAGQPTPAPSPLPVSEPAPASPPPPPPPPPPEPAAPDIDPELDPEPQADQSFFRPDADAPPAVSWTASEFIAHHKSARWYLGLMIITAVLAAGSYLITRGFVSVGVVIVAGAVMGFYASHQPRELQYHVDRRGITIGQKTYSYEGFRSFAVVPEGAFASIILMPLKRFAAPLTMYFAPEDQDQIVSLLALQLPLEDWHNDAVDNLMRRIRF